MSLETFDFCVEGLDGWLATVTDWRERAVLWEDLRDYCGQQAKDLREDHGDELGAAYDNEWKDGE